MNMYVDYWGMMPFAPAANLMPVAGIAFSAIGLGNLVQGNVAGWVQVIIGAALFGVGALLGSL